MTVTSPTAAVAPPPQTSSSTPAPRPSPRPTRRPRPSTGGAGKGGNTPGPCGGGGGCCCCCPRRVMLQAYGSAPRLGGPVADRDHHRGPGRGLGQGLEG